MQIKKRTEYNILRDINHMYKKNTYNRKAFLHPNSHRTMASCHAKVMEDDIMKLTIHDCKGSIQLWNDLKDPDQIQEAFEKLENLLIEIQSLQNFITENYIHTYLKKRNQLENQLT